MLYYGCCEKQEEVMKKDLSDIIDDMQDLVENDQDIGDYAKVFLKYFIDDLVAIEQDKKSMLLNLLNDFKHKNFCDKNWSDCLDCKNHTECNAISTVVNMVSCS